MTERWRPKAITNNTEWAEVKHFHPVKNGRDRFGNRLFVSPDLAYFDRTKDKIKAGILISPAGEELIKKHPGILKQIDSAILLSKDMHTGEVVPIGEDMTLEAIEGGNQSRVYVLTLGENGKEKYVIKIHQPSAFIHQPYINEMLQSQSVATDLEDELSSLGVEMPTFLFASGQVSCSKYEDEDGNYNALNDHEKFKKLADLLVEYIKEKRDIDLLWANIKIDLPVYNDDLLRDKIYADFRSKSDGTVVWIDPFCHRSLR